MSSQTVAVIHPHAASLAAAGPLLHDVVTGRWGTIAAVCAAQMRDQAAAAAALEEAAADAEIQFGDLALIPVTVESGCVVWQATAGEVCTAVDLLQRVLIGQWREVARLAALAGKPSPNWDLDASPARLGRLRQELSRPGAFPDHPGASWSISAGPEASRLAYHVWKQLGGGTDAPATFTPLGGAPQVQVAGEPDRPHVARPGTSNRF